MHSPGRRGFVTRVFESPAIKSWKDSEAPRLRAALIQALDAIREGRPLVIDLLVDMEAAALEPRLETSNVLLWRSRPSTGFGARVRRTLGFYSGESTLAAAVQVETGAELDALLPDTALWDAEFTIFPPPQKALTELPDPHFEVPGFAAAVRWSVSQDAASEGWMVTALGTEGLDMVCGTLTKTFSLQGLGSSLQETPEF